ncbi:MAG: polysaccharide deacetylase [Candidatus Abyssobacteria bacterium SURF_5]|uniref:Polysaccharide deacetylase n=1 Tax=Abyssobacteria bacterium (strain SURF_5) TaxID=2093360 RepID=A0A3A4NS09_ABYX5|nr:MAG: polysaccharide deacetylase [Candidatus Abyssubacteria bacterium SURF_5]
MNKITRRKFLKHTGVAMLLSSSLSRRVFAESNRIPVLLYHDISDQYLDDYTTSPSLFAAHMEWLYSEGYRAVSPKALPIAGFGREKDIVVTFDDGYASFTEYVFPILQQYKFTAVINIIGEYVGRYLHFGGNRPLLSWDEYRFLANSGLVEFGCHTHALHKGKGAAGISPEQLRQDLATFSDIFSSELGVYPEILAWPFGSYNQKTIEVAKKQGVKYFFTSDEGMLSPSHGLDRIPRLNINNKLDLASFRQYVGGVWA